MDGKVLLEALLASLFFSEILISGAPQMKSFFELFGLSQRLDEETRCLSWYRSETLHARPPQSMAFNELCKKLIELHCSQSATSFTCETHFLRRNSLNTVELLSLPQEGEE